MFRNCCLFLVLFITVVNANIFDYEVFDGEGRIVKLSNFKSSNVILVVNVASNCGFTYTNYRELITLYDKYRANGLEILAFPCNQFGEQEPGTNQEIQQVFVFIVIFLLLCFLSINIQFNDYVKKTHTFDKLILVHKKKLIYGIF
jgi:glutathione peroxidase-family protein